MHIIQNGTTIAKFIHVLVAQAFKEECGTPESIDWQVHHKDYNTRNNKSSNLQYVSKGEHIKIHNADRERREAENGESTESKDNNNKEGRE